MVGSREDLSRSRVSNASNAERQRAKDSQSSQHSAHSYHNMSAIEGNRGSQAISGRSSGDVTSSPATRRHPRPTPRQSSGLNDDSAYYADERF